MVICCSSGRYPVLSRGQPVALEAVNGISDAPDETAPRLAVGDRWLLVQPSRKPSADGQEQMAQAPRSTAVLIDTFGRGDAETLCLQSKIAHLVRPDIPAASITAGWTGISTALEGPCASAQRSHRRAENHVDAPRSAEGSEDRRTDDTARRSASQVRRRLVHFATLLKEPGFRKVVRQRSREQRVGVPPYRITRNRPRQRGHPSTKPVSARRLGLRKTRPRRRSQFRDNAERYPLRAGAPAEETDEQDKRQDWVKPRRRRVLIYSASPRRRRRCRRIQPRRPVRRTLPSAVPPTRPASHRTPENRFRGHHLRRGPGRTPRPNLFGKIRPAYAGAAWRPCTVQAMAPRIRRSNSVALIAARHLPAPGAADSREMCRRLDRSIRTDGRGPSRRHHTGAVHQLRSATTRRTPAPDPGEVVPTTGAAGGDRRARRVFMLKILAASVAVDLQSRMPTDDGRRVLDRTGDATE